MDELVLEFGNVLNWIVEVMCCNEDVCVEKMYVVFLSYVVG